MCYYGFFSQVFSLLSCYICYPSFMVRMEFPIIKLIMEGKADKVRDASYYHFYSHGKRLPEMIGVHTDRYKLIHYPGMDGFAG